MSNLKMNCGYCGRKCSLDKDFCIPQDSVYICKSCYDWKQKVADLEAKLAESEKLNKRLQQIVDKLRDKEFAGETLVNAVNAVYEPLYQNKYDEAEQLKQQLAETDKLMQEYLSKCLSLEQQLENKEKEVEENENEWREICDGKLETINRLIEEKHELEQIITSKSHNKWLKAEAERYKNEYQSLKGYVDQLKQQLEESEKLKDDAMYNYAWLNQDLSDTKEQLKVEKDAFKILSNNYNTLISAYDQLKQQLAESEKTEDGAFWFEKWQHKKRDYDSVYKAYIENCAAVVLLKHQLEDKEKESLKYFNEYRAWKEKCELLEQDQNQTAIAELEKVKEYNRGLVYSSSLIDKFINQQIKELKGEIDGSTN